MKQKSWIVISGALWALIGCFLLYKGLRHVADLAAGAQSGLFGGGEQGALWIVAVGLFIGFIKGRFILSKTVQRVCSRIETLTPPIQIGQVYAASYLFLIGGMVLLGMSLRFIPVPIDIKGLIDIAIGSALLNGSLLYFRSAQRV